MQPLHLADDARASSLLRRVTGDLYIDGSSTGPAPVSRPTLWYRDATRLLRWCATRRPDTPYAIFAHLVHLTTVLPPRCARVPGRTGGRECRRAMSPVALTTVGQRHRPGPFTHLTHPSFFAVVLPGLPFPPPPPLSIYLKTPVRSMDTIAKNVSLRNRLESINFIAP